MSCFFLKILDLDFSICYSINRIKGGADMEILYRMYNHPNFGLYLFTVITILAILFVIVLILALKDAKKAKLLENKIEDDKDQNQNDNFQFKDEIAQDLNNDFAFQSESKPIDLSVDNPILKQDIPQDTEENNELSEISKNENDYRLKNEENFDFQPVPEYEEESEFKTAIFNSINEDQNMIETEDITTPVLEPIKEPEISKIFEEKESLDTIKETKPNVVPIEQPTTKEEKPIYEHRTNIPEQFSSVYVNTKPEKVAEDIMPKAIDSEPKTIPLKPNNKENQVEELPKFKDLPTPKPIKLNNIPTPDFNSLDQVEKETYEIK